MITIDVRDTVSGALKASLGLLEDLRLPLKQSGLYMQKSFIRQFQAQGKPKWTPLQIETILARRGVKRELARYKAIKLKGLRGKKRKEVSASLTVGVMLNQLEAMGTSALSFIDKSRVRKKSRKKKIFIRSGRIYNILQDTGRLRRSYVSRSRNSIWTLTKYQLEMGSNLAYAAIHQFGGIIRRKATDKAGSYQVRIPSRPLDFQPEDYDAIASIFNDYILYPFKGKQYK